MTLQKATDKTCTKSESIRFSQALLSAAQETKLLIEDEEIIGSSFTDSEDFPRHAVKKSFGSFQYSLTGQLFFESHDGTTVTIGFLTNWIFAAIGCRFLNNLFKSAL